METAFKLLPSASPSFPDKTVNEESSWELWSTVVILLTSPHRLGMSQERFQDTLLDNQDLRMRYRPNVMPFYTAAVFSVDTGNQWHKRQMQSKKSRVFAHASTQRFSLLSRTCVSESGASKACENDAGCHPDPLKQHLLFRLKTTRRFFLEKRKAVSLPVVKPSWRSKRLPFNTISSTRSCWITSSSRVVLTVSRSALLPFHCSVDFAARRRHS